MEPSANQIAFCKYMQIHCPIAFVMLPGKPMDMSKSPHTSIDERVQFEHGASHQQIN